MVRRVPAGMRPTIITPSPNGAVAFSRSSGPYYNGSQGYYRAPPPRGY